MTFKQKVLFVLLLKDLNSSPMFKRTVLILLLTLFGFHANSQILDPVDWEISSKKIDDTSFELIFTASMDMGWAIYSQDVEDGGPAGPCRPAGECGAPCSPRDPRAAGELTHPTWCVEAHRHSRRRADVPFSDGAVAS